MAPSESEESEEIPHTTSWSVISYNGFKIFMNLSHFVQYFSSMIKQFFCIHLILYETNLVHLVILKLAQEFAETGKITRWLAFKFRFNY